MAHRIQAESLPTLTGRRGVKDFVGQFLHHSDSCSVMEIQRKGRQKSLLCLAPSFSGAADHRLSFNDLTRQL